MSILYPGGIIKSKCSCGLEISGCLFWRAGGKPTVEWIWQDPSTRQWHHKESLPWQAFHKPDCTIKELTQQEMSDILTIQEIAK